jgi:cation:H+ antiporter
MWLNLLLLLVGFAILIKGADYLVTGASSLAKRYGVSELAIGLTVVAFGTSMPEFVVSTFASVQGNNDVAFGNIIGSNNFNILLILGICGLIYPLVVQLNTTWKEIPLSMLAAVLMFVLVNDDMIFGTGENILSRIDGIILLVFFAAFLFYIFKTMKSESVEAGFETTKILKPSTTAIMIIVGLVGLIFGGQLVVDNSISIAQAFGISEKLIALTIVAAGTSLPELATSAVAAFKKKSDIAIGNIVGSNIFNIFLILGLSGVIAPIKYNIAMNFDVYVLFGATILLFLAMFSGKQHRLDRWEASIYLVCYFVYVGYLINQG